MVPLVRRRLGRLRRAVGRARRAGPATMYDDGAYFGEGRDFLDRAGLSGYERYDRDSSNADAAAYLLWRHFDVGQALDVGCALGFVVEALRELGVDARGFDVSQWAVDHAAQGARGHIARGDLLEGLPVSRPVPLVSCFETLEHLPPDAVPAAVAELRRVTGRWLVATIPSFGPNPNGPRGWFQVKVRDERVAHYESLGPGYEGPVPYDDLYRDAQGRPIEGHLTIASFGWWTRQFEAAGFERCAEMERRLHRHIYRFGQTKYWNLYVLRVPGTPLPPDPVPPAEALAERERLWGLDRRRPEPGDDDLLRQAWGPDAELP
jgi:SAM-dependent methyltransferase